MLRQDPFFSAEAYKGQQHDITQENRLHILDFWQSNILSVPKPQGKDLWLRCVGEKCKVSKDSSRKLIICSNVIYNPVTSESFPRLYCWIQEGQSTALELKGMTLRTWIIFLFWPECLFRLPPSLTVSKLHSDLVETSNTAKILLQMYQKLILSCPEPDSPFIMVQVPHQACWADICVTWFKWRELHMSRAYFKSLLFLLFPSESHKQSKVGQNQLKIMCKTLKSWMFAPALHIWLAVCKKMFQDPRPASQVSCQCCASLQTNFLI